MTRAELRAKFDENANGFLDADERDRLVDALHHLEDAPDASAVVTLAIG
jgi:hypothetical protein